MLSVRSIHTLTHDRRHAFGLLRIYVFSRRSCRLRSLNSFTLEYVIDTAMQIFTTIPPEINNKINNLSLNIVVNRSNMRLLRLTKQLLRSNLPVSLSVNRCAHRQSTVDADDVEHHSNMASEWWNTHGPVRSLHTLNELR